MITSQGYGLIAELITAVLLIAALTGFITRRTRPWLVGVAITLALLNSSYRVVDLNLTSSATSIALADASENAFWNELLTHLRYQRAFFVIGRQGSGAPPGLLTTCQTPFF